MSYREQDDYWITSLMIGMMAISICFYSYLFGVKSEHSRDVRAKNIEWCATFIAAGNNEPIPDLCKDL